MACLIVLTVLTELTDPAVGLKLLEDALEEARASLSPCDVLQSWLVEQCHAAGGLVAAIPPLDYWPLARDRWAI